MKIIISCLIISLLAVGCFRKTDSERKSDGTEGIAESISTITEDEVTDSQEDSNQKVEIKIYQNYENEHLFQTVELSGNFPQSAITYLNSNTGLRVKNITYQGTRLIVDFDPIMLTSLNSLGSAGGLQLSNQILRTFSSFPDITEMKFLFNGEEDLEGDHFSFFGIFPAGSSIRTSTGSIDRSQITGLWESEDDQYHIFYFMPDNVYREGRKESAWFRIGKWELNGDMITLTIDSGAYEKLEKPEIEHLSAMINNDKLTLEYSGGKMYILVKSDYIQYLQ